MKRLTEAQLNAIYAALVFYDAAENAAEVDLDALQEMENLFEVVEVVGFEEPGENDECEECGRNVVTEPFGDACAACMER